MKILFLSVILVCLGWAATGGVLRGVVHDPQHRPLEGANVNIQMENETVSQVVRSDANGEFQFPEVPPGTATVSVIAPGFAPFEQKITVGPAGNPILHVQLQLAAIQQSVEVAGAPARLATQSSTVQTEVTPREIEQTAGADQSNSLAMITNFTPGAYMVHDMLHMRGGHQVNWFFDGIPVINTNIAANVAPLINPKNVEQLEVERGGFSSEYGDRTFGFFNVVTPSGFERDNEAQLIVSGGNFQSTDDHFSVGGHTQRFAYYGSVDANRSQLGLSAPVSQVIHDQESGLGGFVSLMYNASSKDQLRWIASVRGDHYQIPNRADRQAAGIRDLDIEQDGLIGFHWTRTVADGILFSLSPYFHFNAAHYIGGPADTPFVLNDNDHSAYLGGRSVLQVQKKRHNARFGVEIWGQRDNNVFAVTANPGGQAVDQQERHWANSDALFVEDQVQLNRWLTLDLGVRLTHYGGLVSENAADPRIGAAIRIPRLKWILHGYYAYYYQPPPLNSLSGPLLQFAVAQGYGFIALRGERDIQHDVGLTIPVGRWTLDVDNFHTSSRNFLDHDEVGDSGIFIPLTDLAGIVRGTEVALRSPRLLNVASLRVAYSNQIAEGVGPVSGGLLAFAPARTFLLDHDQRNTLSSVLALDLPGHFWATPAYHYGSGFLKEDGPAHLPAQSTFDLSVGKRFGEKWSVSVNAMNLANTRYLLDMSNTFGGTHYVNPRQIYAEVRYRFHY